MFTKREGQVLLDLSKFSERDEIPLLELTNNSPTSYPYLKQIMRHFKELGLVDYKPNPEDKRQKIIILTDNGREIISKYHEIKMILNGR